MPAYEASLVWLNLPLPEVRASVASLMTDREGLTTPYNILAVRYNESHEVIFKVKITETKMNKDCRSKVKSNN